MSDEITFETQTKAGEILITFSDFDELVIKNGELMLETNNINGPIYTNLVPLNGNSDTLKDYAEQVEALTMHLTVYEPAVWTDNYNYNIIETIIVSLNELVERDGCKTDFRDIDEERSCRDGLIALDNMELQFTVGMAVKQLFYATEEHKALVAARSAESSENDAFGSYEEWIKSLEHLEYLTKEVFIAAGLVPDPSNIIDDLCDFEDIFTKKEFRHEPSDNPYLEGMLIMSDVVGRFEVMIWEGAFIAASANDLVDNGITFAEAEALAAMGWKIDKMGSLFYIIK